MKGQGLDNFRDLPQKLILSIVKKAMLKYNIGLKNSSKWHLLTFKALQLLFFPSCNKQKLEMR